MQRKVNYRLKTKISPILIIGTQRSGSNLLRLMLNQLPQIEAPHPPHLLQVFSPLVPAYGSLEEDKNFQALIGDIMRFIEANPVPWSNIELNPDKIFERCESRSLVEIFRVVYEMKAELKGAAYWCCKSMANVYFIPEIEDSGMKPFYIHLLRDGRDVAASFRNAIVGEKHPFFIAKQWVREQELANAMTARLPAERTVVLRFEEFINDPQRALTGVLTKLEIEWTDDILNYYLSEEAKNTAAAGEMWRNVVKPVDRNNKRHYSEKLSKEEIALFESIAGKALTYYGYKTDNDIGKLSAQYSEQEIRTFNEQNEMLKKEARVKYVKDAEARAKQENVLKDIKKRLGK